MSTKNKCSKCDGVMIEGFVFDRGQSLKLQQVWVEGNPESSIWAGLKTSNREMYHVQASRCADCSYLEFYTTERIYT